MVLAAVNTCLLPENNCRPAAQESGFFLVLPDGQSHRRSVGLVCVGVRYREVIRHWYKRWFRLLHSRLKCSLCFGVSFTAAARRRPPPHHRRAAAAPAHRATTAASRPPAAVVSATQRPSLCGVLGGICLRESNLGKSEAGEATQVLRKTGKMRKT